MGMAGWIILGIIVVAGLWLVATYNGLVALRQRCRQAFSDIDVQLKQRHDLVPNLVETVKGYAAHEKGTLEAVIKARNAAVARAGARPRRPRPRARCRVRCARSSRWPRPIPTSRPTRTSSSCRPSSSDLENKIAAARRFFNNAAAEYNSTRESFPAVLFAQSHGLLAAGVLQPRGRRAQGRAGRAAGEVLRSSRRLSPGSSHPHARQPVIGGSRAQGPG